MQSDRYKRKSYINFRQFLGSKGIKNPGPVASLLLHVFVDGDGKIYRNTAEIFNVITKNESFKEWRDSLVRMKILSYPYSYKEESDFSFFTPGSLIIKYINEEKNSKCNLATVENCQKEVRKLQKTIELMSKQNIEFVKIAIERFCPPFSEEKFDEVVNLYMNRVKPISEQFQEIRLKNMDLIED